MNPQLFNPPLTPKRLYWKHRRTKARQHQTPIRKRTSLSAYGADLIKCF